MSRPVFPTMLRKMWSGGEVQKWLDENVEEMTTDSKWRELALQFDRHRMQAMALIRAVASGKADTYDCAEFAKSPPPEDGTTSDKYRAELYDEVWQRARDMGYANVTMALDDLAARTQPAPDQIDDVPMHPCIMQLDKLGDL